MKYIKRLSKRTRIISLMILLVMVSATTIAFLQDYTGTVTNTFSLKSIDTEIEENNHDTTLTKMPFVKNTDVTDVMVRIRLDISGDFSQFALAGIDGKYVIGSNFNQSDLKNEENLSFKECGQYSTDNSVNDFWIQDPTGEDNRYSCYYYYKNVLKSKGSKDTNDNPLDVTQPLFDRILLKYEMDDGTIKLLSYKEAFENPELYPDAVKKFAELENIQITVYQESVPVTLKDGDNLYNADRNNNGIIDSFEEEPIVQDKEFIWQYFMTNTNTDKND